jgi:hypothetical protein
VTTMQHQPQPSTAALQTTDPRVAYGARCTWWDAIAAVGTCGLRPCCPYCHGPLNEIASIECWQQDVDVQDAIQPGFKAFIDWLRGHRCYPTLLAAEAAYWTARQVAAPAIAITVRRP